MSDRHHSDEYRDYPTPSELSQPKSREAELEAEILRVTDALVYAHDNGFEWPVDPLPVGSIAWQLRIERGNTLISKGSADD